MFTVYSDMQFRTSPSLIPYFQSIRNSREKNFPLFSSVRVLPFKLPFRGKTKRIQSNLLSFIFIRLHPSTSLSVLRWNKILSLSPSTPQIFSLSLLPFPLLLLSCSFVFIPFLEQENGNSFYRYGVSFWNTVAFTVKWSRHTQCSPIKVSEQYQS